jgi:hypothetical protein
MFTSLPSAYSTQQVPLGDPDTTAAKILITKDSVFGLIKGDRGPWDALFLPIWPP